MRLLVLSLCFFFCFVGVSGQDDRGDRPQLIGNRVVPAAATVASENYEYVLTSLEFDQDVYINDVFLCPGQEKDCAPMNCEPCDWSGESPTGCDNPRCCGAAQWPQFPASNRTNEWCDSSLPPYTTLEFNEPSEVFSIERDEYKYFRFFVGEEHYCRSIRIEVATKTGDMSLTVSNLVAYPNQESLKRIENGQQFEAGSMQRIARNLFAHSVLTVCPNVNPTYERGTFSIALVGFYDLNVASITVSLGEERYPIAPPEERIQCDDLSDDIFERPVYVGNSQSWGGNVCLEEGVTEELVVEFGKWWDFVLPVLPGCRELSFSYNGFTNTMTNSSADPDARLFLTCGRTSKAFQGMLGGATVVVSYGEVGSWYISGCFEEVTYLHCSVGNFFESGLAKFQWSSESKPIRYKISEAPPAMLTTYLGRGQTGLIQEDQDFSGFNDWGTFGYSFVTQPTTDPLIFYPPYGDYAYKYAVDPLQIYIEGGLAETKSNLFNFVDFTMIRGDIVRSKDALLGDGLIFLGGITSATGMPVELCNDADLESGKCERGSLNIEHDWMDFLTTRTVSSMNVVTEAPCDGAAYRKLQDLIKTNVAVGVKSGIFDTLAQKAFLIDLFEAGFTRTACVFAVERALATEVANVTKLQKSYCPYHPTDPEYDYDPCCNIRARVVECCAPTILFVEDELYTGVDPDQTELSCQNPDCAESFFADFATSLNGRENPLLGCASGLQDPEYQLRVFIEERMENFVRPCLESSGYGETFSGIKCLTHEDCASFGSDCDMTEGICRIPHTTQEIRENYFNCFFDNMPPLVEDHIRTRVLSPLDNDFPKDSKYFKEAVRKAATQFDCLPSDPYDLTHSERYASDAALYCKGVGFIDLSEIEQNVDHINEICPEFLCLGEKSCRFEMAKLCRTPLDGTTCFDQYHTLTPASESSCPVTETVCSSTSVLSSPSDCEGEEYECVSCLSEWDSCVVVEGVDSEEECERLVACEVPGGAIRYDLTEEQCLNLGECTSLCDGESCRSVNGKNGACVVEGASDCESIGGVDFEGECILDGIESTYACDQAAIELSLTTEWFMCETMDLIECREHENFTAPYKHLRCFVDRFRECENEGECLATGTCSDIEVTKSVDHDSSGWFSVSYGLCLSSGFMGRNGIVEEPYCFETINELPFKYGCYHRGVTQSYCEFLGSPESFVAPYWTAWVEPARTEETCRQEVRGRYGCAVPKDYELTYWFWQKEDCECNQGTADYLYTWTPGSWRNGTPRPLTWTQKEQRRKYTWEESISLVTMERWVSDAVETIFAFYLKSQLICEGGYVASSLGALVCDCVDGDDSCFKSDFKTPVGVAKACANEYSALKGPSSVTKFNGTSVNDLCSNAALYLIKRSWFLYPLSAPSVSFQFAERKQQGVVQNKNGATVGELMGDGNQIFFENPERIEHFLTCLLISEDDVYAEYTKRDFGVPSSDFSVIRPLGLEKVVEKEEELTTYWCANLTKDQWSGDGIIVFPVKTYEEYKDEEADSLSHRTESLIYTLAACYSFVLIIVVLYLVVQFHKSFWSKKQKGLPIITWLGVILGMVCVFRIVYCFLYVEDKFDEVGEYVVFEIPTFLLFTGVLLVIMLFMQLSRKKGFNFKTQDKRIWGCGLAALIFVWSIFIIVTIVYSEVILEEGNKDDSECPGRVPPNNDELKEDTRTLSIVYYTIVIFLTLLFALVFLRKSLQLLKMTTSAKTKARVFVFRLGAVTVTSFLLRCVLFIILIAADFTSDIYLFITLFLTEVVMILLISLELNKAFYNSVIDAVTETISAKSQQLNSEKSSTQ